MQSNMKNLIAFLFCFWIFSSGAFTCDKPIIGLHTNTYHMDSTAEYRENNMGCSSSAKMVLQQVLMKTQIGNILIMLGIQKFRSWKGKIF